MQKSTKARTFAGGCLREGWKSLGMAVWEKIDELTFFRSLYG
jgi:hypothetical protein